MKGNSEQSPLRHLGAIYRRIESYFLAPETALRNTIALATLWVVLGLIFERSRSDSLLFQSGSKQSVSWHGDMMGHYLISLTLVTCFCIKYYEHVFHKLVPMVEEYRRKERKWLRRWFVVCALIFLGMANGNAIYVIKGSGLLYWHHDLIPFWGPYLVAIVYYVFCILPLFMALLKLGGRLLYAAKRPQEVKGFYDNDPQNCFGVPILGNLLVVFTLFLILFSLPPSIYQLVQYETGMSGGSLFGVAFVFVVLYSTVLKPGVQLSSILTKIKSESLEKRLALLNELKEEVRDDPTRAEVYAFYRESYASLQEQSVMPVSKPFAIFSFLGIVPMAIATALAWFSEMGELLKGLPFLGS